MGKILSAIRIIGALMFSINSHAQESATLTVDATDFKSADGSAIINLFREQDDIPKKPFKIVRAAIKNGRAKFVFENLTIGSYAAVVWHDENNNGILDHNFFPSEPMAFSNDWHLSIFSGVPTFKKLKFDFNSVNNRIEVKLK